jgi:hypothetical protein
MWAIRADMDNAMEKAAHMELIELGCYCIGYSEMGSGGLRRWDSAALGLRR